MAISSGYLFNAQGFGALNWGTVTVGKPGMNYSVSAGHAFFRNPMDYELYQALSFGLAGVYPIGRNTSIMYDSMWFLHSSDAVGSLMATLQMPSMRFQWSETMAFQFSLGGVYGLSDGDVFAFPLPMCSFLYRL